VSFAELLADLEHLGIRPAFRDGHVKLVGPRSKLTPEVVKQADVHWASLLDYARAQQDEVVAAQASELSRRLKGYTIPAGKMRRARDLAVRIRGITHVRSTVHGWV
jgi:hypothetical protein